MLLIPVCPGATTTLDRSSRLSGGAESPTITLLKLRERRPDYKESSVRLQLVPYQPTLLIIIIIISSIIISIIITVTSLHLMYTSRLQKSSCVVTLRASFPKMEHRHLIYLRCVTGIVWLITCRTCISLPFVSVSADSAARYQCLTITRRAAGVVRVVQGKKSNRIHYVTSLFSVT